jgi:hypothetical protein
MFLCFVWISEQTAIIYLCSTNWQALITERECDFCAVRAESLNVIHVNFGLYGRAKAQAVSHRPLTSKSRVQSQVSSCEFCSVQSTSVFNSAIVSPKPLKHSDLRVALTRRINGQSLGTSKRQFSFGKMRVMDRNINSYFWSLKG